MGGVSNLDTRLLDRRVYDVGEAATFLELPPSTLRRWLLGDVRKGRRYLPVLRDENNDDTTVRWGEFIEAGVLKALRGEHKVDLQELRVFCHTLRHTEGLPYPLGMKEILLNGPRLLYPLRLANIEALVDADGQILTGPAIELFVSRVRWDGDQPVAYRPSPEHPRVEINPRLRFGEPQVAGVSTAAVYELHAAGEPISLLAETWNVDPDVIHAAMEYETDRRRPARAA